MWCNTRHHCIVCEEVRPLDVAAAVSPAFAVPGLARREAGGVAASKGRDANPNCILTSGDQLGNQTWDEISSLTVVIG